MARHVLDSSLWRMHHESAAHGAAIGIFWAFVLPVEPILVLGANFVLGRGGQLVSPGMPLPTNPFTVRFWLLMAYEFGGLVMDAPQPQPLISLEKAAVFWMT